MNLNFYTDYAKARALEDTVQGLRLLLDQYSRDTGLIAETATLVGARFLDLIYKCLQDPDCEEHKIMESK